DVVPPSVSVGCPHEHTDLRVERVSYSPVVVAIGHRGVLQRIQLQKTASSAEPKRNKAASLLELSRFLVPPCDSLCLTCTPELLHSRGSTDVGMHVDRVVACLGSRAMLYDPVSRATGVCLAGSSRRFGSRSRVSLDRARDDHFAVPRYPR